MAACFGASLNYIRQVKSDPNSEKFSFDTDGRTDRQKKSAGVELRFAAKNQFNLSSSIQFRNSSSVSRLRMICLIKFLIPIFMFGRICTGI